MAFATRHPFVDDLIPLILEASDHWWTQDYLRLACVSPSWLFYIQKRLYACPSIGSFAASAALVRTFEENPGLLHLVSGIELQPMLREHESVATQAPSIQFLLGLEGLKRIKLGGQLAKQAQRFLNALAFPELVEEVVVDGGLLQEAGWLPFPSNAMEWDEGLLYRFPRLQKLRLANLELDLIPRSGTARFPINHLILDDVAIAGGFLCQSIASANTLTICTKSAVEYDEQIRLVLNHCDVDVLEYEVRANQCGARSILDTDATTPLPLRRLRLDGYTTDTGLLADIAQRCTTLQELSIGGRGTAVTAQEWVAFISSGALPALERLQLPGGTNAPPFEKWTPTDLLAIEGASKANKIQLVI